MNSLEQSLVWAQQTTISWDEFLRRVATGTYDYRKARWNYAGKALETAIVEAKQAKPDQTVALTQTRPRGTTVGLGRPATVRKA